MKIELFTLLTILCCGALSATTYVPQNGESYQTDGSGNIISYGPAAGEEGSQAIHMSSSDFKGWATGYKDLVYGTQGNPVADNWKTPEKALGPATGSVFDVVCLGEGGQITFTFDHAIANGEGADFAVFENSFNQSALELSFVEVSTDGTHFVRFPNFYLGETSMGKYDNYNYPQLIYNLASKYSVEYGHGFDLQELVFAYNYALDTPQSESAFSVEYTQHLLEMYTYLDLEEINYVRLIDIVGDGTIVDSAGHPIYDPTGSYGSPGSDIQAVGVINYAPIPEPSTCALCLALIALCLSGFKRGAKCRR